ncbi:tRNA uridine-5-carboxymethylaminomethyl(34) synthesis GTPase MnmE [Marivivens donghaensis]|uniref:tRNA modification GTPase MnmE n=1 Tax=Marivivens donghaensis TaxID=1699413 RepID=A0ABX0VTU8_9RHOB|nr:tRNA uridine-5-carboxymethylaminomethyl(34) synthesis GTPase MnmE [Marivivens donghaensis]NIY71444.1 tRNA uridine-5-carboxymethylaminomethyl(34) synthesis GTPase MnmE [Marivivens donghaensis]
MDTIYALATASGKAGVAVVRVSGPLAFEAGRRMSGDLPKSRGVRRIVDGQGDLIDEALVLVFEPGKSFTGEAVVEFQLHGSPAIVATVLRELSEIDGLRHAEAGEFTRRALENGKLDLAQVEGLADLIEAETEAQRKQALRVFQGALGTKVESWRERLVRAAALVEATIDFVDEDVPVDVMPEVRELLTSVRDEMQVEADGVRVAERIRDGFEVAIVGAPNVGKSTLLNRLAGRQAAITSDIAGTTRDVIEVRMDLGGLPVTILDTAGLRETDDVVESLGIGIAKQRAAAADMVVYMVVDPSEVEHDFGSDSLIVIAKDDDQLADGVGISGKTGAGVDRLVSVIEERLRSKTARIGVAMRERHRIALLKGCDALDLAMGLVDTQTGLADLIAEEIRTAARATESLVGRVDVEDLLDVIFSSFCIGK